MRATSLRSPALSSCVGLVASLGVPAIVGLTIGCHSPESATGAEVAVASPLPQVVSSGGPVLTAPVVVPLVFASDPEASALETFVSQVARSEYWAQATAEYGVGPLAASAPIEFQEEPIAITDDAAIRAWLMTKLSSPGFPQPTAETIYELFSAVGTLDFEEGYHSDFVLPGGASVIYAIVGTNGGIDNATAVASHELAEAATDPHPVRNPAWSDLDRDHQGWELLGDDGAGLAGGEIADVCLFSIQASVTVLGGPDAQAAPLWSMPWVPFHGIDHFVQRVWFNRAAAAGHDPCVPFGLSPYFNSAPVLPDTVTASDSTGHTFTTRGVHIPVGQTATVELDLFSDAPTDPWNLEVEDLSGGEPLNCNCVGFVSNSAVFDRAQGRAGDRVHLTITMNAASGNGTSLFRIVNRLGDRFTAWPIVIVN